MKLLRPLFAAGLVLAGVAAFAAAPKTQTYSVVGYFKGAKPSDDLLAKATAAVAAKVTGMSQIADADQADHSVEVLFTRNSFELYVDALPIDGRYLDTAADLNMRTIPIDYAWERAQDRAQCDMAPKN